MTSREEALLTAGAARLDVELGPEAIERLGRFVDVLSVWNRRVRLTGERDRHALLVKHVIDSLALVPHLPASGLVVDVGSGAGFPGIVLGCARPDLRLVLIESRRRPASFLAEAVRTIPLPHVGTLEARAEDAPDDPELRAGALRVVARAVRLEVFLRLALPLLAPAGIAVAMQTPRADGLAEATAARLGLRLAGSRDYALAGGERRRLLLFARDGAASPPVSSPDALC